MMQVSNFECSTLFTTGRATPALHHLVVVASRNSFLDAIVWRRLTSRISNPISPPDLSQSDPTYFPPLEVASNPSQMSSPKHDSILDSGYWNSAKPEAKLSIPLRPATWWK